ncbi:MAG: hypothetical protein HQK91_05805 [Nitrospirae bacterium]|nr:hypothetical protein [Nitrospirota bacterium]
MIKNLIILFTIISSLIIIFISFNRYTNNLVKENENLSKKYEKVYDLADKYALLSKTKTDNKKIIKAGLLSYIQDVSNGLNIKITAIKPIQGDTDKINIIYQKISYKNILDIVTMIDSVSNIKIINFSLMKRFDDPEYMNLDLQIEKL